MVGIKFNKNSNAAWIVAKNKKKIYLRPGESTILMLVMCRKIVDYHAIIECLWPDPDMMALTAMKVAQVHICRINKKLSSAGCRHRIKNVYGRGYYLHQM